jgi:dTDP-4-dehydrorhamnose reductase
MRALVTGASGQLGSDFCKVAAGFELFPLSHAEIEITDIKSVEAACRKFLPEVIVNTAAYVRVDESESNTDTAYRVNALGARNMAVAAHELGAKLVHISTDYVFGGENKPNPQPYTEFDTPLPVNTYGRSKLAGEDLVRHLCHRHFIIRTSGLFGAAGSRGKGSNFVETMLRLSRERNELRVVNDQVFSPTCSRDLARKIAQLIATEYYGVFHITNRGACSWYHFTAEILRLTGLRVRLVPISSEEYASPARRPRFSVLDNYHLRLLGIDEMRPWQEALKDYLLEKGHIKR